MHGTDVVFLGVSVDEAKDKQKWMDFIETEGLKGCLLYTSSQSPNIYAAAVEYMDYRHYGIIFVCFNFLFRSLYIGLFDTKVISFTTAIMAMVNIFLDYVLIFGKWGFPEMGVGLSLIHI